MQTIYCIPGLGADEGAFQYLDLSFAEPVFIKWISPYNNEPLQAYAMRVKQQFIHEPNPVLVGLSLGGMIAVEIAKATPAAKAIIISSAATKNAIPFYWRFFRNLPVYKILPEWLAKKYSPLSSYYLGIKSKEAKNYVKHVAKHADIKFYRWAIGAILNWQNQTAPSNIIHIHGTNDKLLPYKFAKPGISIRNGGHLMIIENAGEISELIKRILNK